MLKLPLMTLSFLPWLAFLLAVFILIFLCYRWRKHEACTVQPMRERLQAQEAELKRVRDTDAARNLFLASLSHELRTPLSGITGAIRLLQATGLNTRQQEYARMAAGASATVLEIVDDMLTFSRIRAGQLAVERTAFGLRTLIDDVFVLQNMKAQQRHIVLVRDVPPEVPEFVSGDAGKLKQILLNLVGNAIKFSDEGTVTVEVSLVDQSADALHLEFVVRDTGKGIPANELQRVFEPFVQGAGASRGGTGLGLAICQRLTQVMGGTLRLESEPGVGTAVHLQLVLTPTSAAEKREKRGQTPISAPIEKPATLKVLVIEDDEINRLVCTRYLALAGHFPMAAAEARQVFQWAQHAAERPDVLLLDMHLGADSGVEVLGRLRAQFPAWQEVPVLAMSADISGEAQQHALAAGVRHFLGKPFTARQLESALQTVSGGRSRSRRHYSLDEGVLDLAFLQEERATLGDDIVLELLNIFRAGAAARLAAMAEAVGRRDWQLVKDEAHALQGSAANLGMSRVLVLARSLRDALGEEDDCVPHTILAGVNELELAVHEGADALRALLMTRSEQNVTLAAHGND